MYVYMPIIHCSFSCSCGAFCMFATRACVKRMFVYNMCTLFIHLFICFVFVSIDRHPYIHPYIHTYIHTYILALALDASSEVLGKRHYKQVVTYIHTYIHTCVRTYIHTYIHTHIHTYIHSYIHTYIHSFIHSFMRTPRCLPLCACVEVHPTDVPGARHNVRVSEGKQDVCFSFPGQQRHGLTRLLAAVLCCYVHSERLAAFPWYLNKGGLSLDFCHLHPLAGLLCLLTLSHHHKRRKMWQSCRCDALSKVTVSIAL